MVQLYLIFCHWTKAIHVLVHGFSLNKPQRARKRLGKGRGRDLLYELRLPLKIAYPLWSSLAKTPWHLLQQASSPSSPTHLCLAQLRQWLATKF